MWGIIFILVFVLFNMDYKKIGLLVIFVGIVVSLFFLSSWTNAMVVSEGGIGAVGNVSPFLAGVFIVVSVGVVLNIVADKFS